MGVGQPVEQKVSEIETAIRELVYLQHKNEMQINQLSLEMKEFKDEMRAYKEEMRRESREMNKRWGEMSNKLGTIVEDLVAPAIEPVILKYFNREPVETAIRVRKRKGGARTEFDAVSVCEDKVFLFEVKASPRKDYIDEFLQRQIPLFKSMFPEHAEKELVPIFCSLRLEDFMVEYCTRNKVYAMAYREWDYMDILNFEDLAEA